MHIPDFMRRVNRVVTNPILGTIAWLVPPFAVVHHVGRKSGRPYHNPVIAFRSKGGFIIPMTYGRDVDWGRNLLAAGNGEVIRMGRRSPVRNPRIVDGAVAYPLLPPVVRSVMRLLNFPGYVLADVASGSPA
jgi:deazaflavin-dependent oxidoreductase (nitroreductase family)